MSLSIPEAPPPADNTNAGQNWNWWDQDYPLASIVSTTMLPLYLSPNLLYSQLLKQRIE